MHCLIIDDNSKTAETLGALLTDHPGVETVHKAVQPYLFRSLMVIEPINLIFTRVRLWNPAVYAKLPQMLPVVFLSGGKDKLTDKTDTGVPYKLREPYSIHELNKLFDKLKHDSVIEDPAYFFVRVDSRFHRIFFRDIEMIERLKLGYFKIFTRHTTLLVSGSLPQYIRQLPEGVFIRISDTLILPMGKINAIKDNIYEYRGRKIELTFRFAASAGKEMEKHTDWNLWAGQD